MQSFVKSIAVSVAVYGGVSAVKVQDVQNLPVDHKQVDEKTVDEILKKQISEETDIKSVDTAVSENDVEVEEVVDTADKEALAVDEQTLVDIQKVLESPEFLEHQKKFVEQMASINKAIKKILETHGEKLKDVTTKAGDRMLVFFTELAKADLGDDLKKTAEKIVDFLKEEENRAFFNNMPQMEQAEVSKSMDVDAAIVKYNELVEYLNNADGGVLPKFFETILSDVVSKNNGDIKVDVDRAIKEATGMIQNLKKIDETQAVQLKTHMEQVKKMFEAAEQEPKK